MADTPRILPVGAAEGLHTRATSAHG